LVGYDEGNMRDSLGDGRKYFEEMRRWDEKEDFKKDFGKVWGEFFLKKSFEFRSYGKLSDWTC
jgi:hypothetical protein